MSQPEPRRFLRQHKWRQVSNVGAERWLSPDRQSRTLVGGVAEQLWRNMSANQWRPA
jgi:hypothetical protein